MEDMVTVGINLSHQKALYITGLFKKPIYKNVAEDVSEWVANLQICERILERIIEEKLEKYAPIEIIQGIISTLTLYENKLMQLEKSGRIVRFFVSHRLRKQLDHLNSFLCMQVSGLEAEIKSKINVPFKSSIKYLQYENLMIDQPSSPTPSRIQNPSASKDPSEDKFIEEVTQIWASLFGKETFVVTWVEFLSQFKTKTPVNPTEENVLKDIIDHSNTGNVNHYKFIEFLKGFGPLENCVHNAVRVYHEHWFYGFMSREEAKRFLETEPYGTFLVRFSSTKPASFAISYVGFQFSQGEDSSYQQIPSMDQTLQEVLSVQNILVSASGIGLKVQDKNQHKIFKSLKEILTYYGSILRSPFVSDLPEKSWFHGDLQGDEAQELLEGQPVGTFLVRFSSKPGSYATSFVVAGGKVNKALLNKVEGGYKLESSVNNRVYPSIQDFVKDYMGSGIFKQAFRHIDGIQRSTHSELNNQRGGSSFALTPPKTTQRSVPSLFLDDLPCVLDEQLK